MASMETVWKERIAACEAAGLTRKQIAEYCGVPYSTLNDLALGYTKEPKGMAAVKLFNLSEPHLSAYQQRASANEPGGEPPIERAEAA